jgi:hypothetical protein
MNRYAKQLFPDWVNDDNTKQYDLILSNDVDSLLSCIFLEKIKRCNINYFFNFNSIFRANEPKNPIIGVDVDLKTLKCWGNHFTRNCGYHNPNSANLNNIIVNDYYSKYAGSTLLEIISYYDYDISQFSEEAKMVLLAIDSTYLGYYSKNFKDIHKKWFINVLQLKDLYSILQNHNESDFIDVIKKYNLNGRIWIDKNGYLQTNIKLDEISKIFRFDIELPNQKFIKSRDFQYKIREAENLINIDVEKIVSVARTRLNEVKISIAY